MVGASVQFDKTRHGRSRSHQKPHEEIPILKLRIHPPTGITTKALQSGRRVKAVLHHHHPNGVNPILAILVVLQEAGTQAGTMIVDIGMGLQEIIPVIGADTTRAVVVALGVAKEWEVPRSHLHQVVTINGDITGMEAEIDLAVETITGEMVAVQAPIAGMGITQTAVGAEERKITSGTAMEQMPGGATVKWRLVCGVEENVGAPHQAGETRRLNPLGGKTPIDPRINAKAVVALWMMVPHTGETLPPIKQTTGPVNPAHQVPQALICHRMTRILACGEAHQVTSHLAAGVTGLTMDQATGEEISQ